MRGTPRAYAFLYAYIFRYNQFSESCIEEPHEKAFCNIACIGATHEESKQSLLNLCRELGIHRSDYPCDYFLNVDID